MTYQQAIDYLYASAPAFHMVGKSAYKPGLDNTLSLMRHLGNPHTKLRAVHIAGTNGKGSTSHLIAASLQCAGLKVGLYTSPHLVDFRERIRVLCGSIAVVATTVAEQSDLTMIPQQAVIQFVQDNQSFLDQLRPSFFETAMAMAFWYFAKEKVDIAVIEVGLGGRLDSTNVLPPYNLNTQTGVQLSVITNIGFDHTEFLGHTLTAIATEKAGIIKPNVPVVIGETGAETAPVFMAKADECGILGHGLETSDCRIWFADQCEYLLRCRVRDIPECQLHGIYQQHNMQTAYVALRALNVPTSAIRQGFAQVCTLTGLRGRWEVLSQHPLTICDTGHNSHGLHYVAEQLINLHKSKNNLHIIFGMVDDKDISVVMTLLPTDATYYWTQAQTHRAISATQMQTLGAAHHLLGNAYPSVKAAISAAQKATTDQDLIFIGGSNYVVGEALPLF